jgi:hypothetical protein
LAALGVSVVRGPFSWLNQACWAGFVASVALTVLLVEWEVVVWPVHDLRAVDMVSLPPRCLFAAQRCVGGEVWRFLLMPSRLPAGMCRLLWLPGRALAGKRDGLLSFSPSPPPPARLQRLAMWADATTAAAFAAAADDSLEPRSSTGGGSGGFIKAHNRSAEAEAYVAAATAARTLSMGQPRLPQQ